MPTPTQLPLWIMKEKDCDDDYPYTFIYKINNRLYIIEYADSEGQIRGGKKNFMNFSEVKECYFESNDFDMIVYNPEQSEYKHSNFIMNLPTPNIVNVPAIITALQNSGINFSQTPNNNNTPNNELVDEDPSSEDSEDPVSE